MTLGYQAKWKALLIHLRTQARSYKGLTKIEKLLHKHAGIFEEILKTRWKRQTAILPNVFGVKDARSRPAVGVSYILTPYLLDSGSEPFFNHSNIQECFEIGRIFADLGFVVDAIDCNADHFVPRRHYQVFFDNRGDMLSRIEGLLPAECLRIGYFTGQHWLDNNLAEYQRLADLRRRRGVALVPRRIWPHGHFDSLDAAILIGNSVMKLSYSGLSCPVYQVPLSVHRKHFWELSRSWEQSKKTFLWLGSGGAVHKGLDLVLEAFACLPSLELHVVGPVDREHDFFQTYREELLETPNIHYHGFINMMSDQFRALAQECGSLILPTCAEGTSVGVLNVMARGMIPIVSRECAVDVGDAGIILHDCQISTIQETVLCLASMSSEELLRRSDTVQDYIRLHHSVPHFTTAMRDAISTILSSSSVAQSIRRA